MSFEPVLPDVDDASSASDSAPAFEEPTFRASKKRRNWTPLWILLGIFACVGFIALGVWLVNISGGISMPELPDTTINQTYPTRTPAPSVFNNARETATLPSGNTSDPLSGYSIQVQEILKLNFSIATPGPGAGPEKQKSECPVMNFPLPTNNQFGHFARFMNELNEAKMKLGLGKLTTCEVVDKFFPWFFNNEQGGVGKFSVTDGDGNSWYNCTLESFGGCKFNTEGEILVIAELGDTRLDLSGADCRPYAPGSTDGKWGIHICTGSGSTVNGLIWQGADYSGDVSKGASLK